MSHSLGEQGAYNADEEFFLEYAATDGGILEWAAEPVPLVVIPPQEEGAGSGPNAAGSSRHGVRAGRGGSLVNELNRESDEEEMASQDGTPDEEAEDEIDLAKKLKDEATFPEVDAKLIIPSGHSTDKDMEVQGGTKDPAVHYTPSIITEGLIEKVREDYRWGPGVEIKIPEADVFASTHIPGWSVIFTYPFTIGLGLPLHPVIAAICKDYGVCVA